MWSDRQLMEVRYPPSVARVAWGIDRTRIGNWKRHGAFSGGEDVRGIWCYTFEELIRLRLLRDLTAFCKFPFAAAIVNSDPVAGRIQAAIATPLRRDDEGGWLRRDPIPLDQQQFVLAFVDVENDTFSVRTVSLAQLLINLSMVPHGVWLPVDAIAISAIDDIIDLSLDEDRAAQT